jgi:uncharacterized DUF497 family protein
VLTIKKLLWNDINIAHIARHQVTAIEVEQTCWSRHITFETYDNRILLVGMTKAERMISVVLAPKDEGKWLPVTARPSSRKERRLYQQLAGENAA